MTEKVEYFGNKDIMIYLLICFGVGMTIGASFAHYKNVRFNLINKRMNTIESTHKSLLLGYDEITKPKKLALYHEVQKYKGRSFDTGCTTKDGEFRFNTTFTKKPKLLLTNNGILVNSTLALGKWE
jgi:hypothetical protein